MAGTPASQGHQLLWDETITETRDPEPKKSQKTNSSIRELHTGYQSAGMRIAGMRIAGIH